MSREGPFRSEVVEAIVQIADDEIPYRRAGRGGATLLLCEPGQPEREAVFQRLATLGLVVEPLALPRPGPAEWARWLRGIVDGLGLDRPDLVVSPGLAAGARRFLEEDPQSGGSVLLIEEIAHRSY